jgi:tellurite resistance protein TehA-like permease
MFCTATTQLGIELGSGGFRILGTILSLIEVLLWLFCSILTLVQVLRGKV